MFTRLAKAFFVPARMSALRSVTRMSVGAPSQMVRSFATDRAAEIRSVPGNKPPMLEETVHARYAGVLFSIASQREALADVLEDLRYLKDLTNKSESFRTFLSNASFKRREQAVVLDEIKGELSEVTVNFLGTLIENKRIDSLPKIIEKYIDYYRIINKEEAVTIISAQDLAEEDRTRVIQALKESNKGVNFTIKFQVDPSILGGLQMYSGNKFMDASMLSRITKIKSELGRITV